MSKSVTFDDENEIFYISYDGDKKLRYDENNNRRLSFLEEYMRTNSLLMKNEYLCVVTQTITHIRIPYIEFIAKQFGLLPNNKHLEILTT